jgi:O-antigen ligase
LDTSLNRNRALTLPANSPLSFVWNMLRTLATWVLKLEPFLLVLVVFLFWMTPERLEYLWLFAPPLVARLILFRRLWTPTPLDVALIALIALVLFNYKLAPYSRSLWMASRAFMAVPLALAVVEFARRRKSTDQLMIVTLLLSLLVGVLALGSSQWADKSLLLKPITDALPDITNFPGSVKGFNVNEIAGAIAWLMPFAGGIAIFDWRENNRGARRNLATVAFLALWLALFLGQSRMAIFGVVFAMGILITFLVPRGRWQVLSYLILVAFTALEIVLFIGIFSPDTNLESRDENSFQTRIEMWQRAVEIIVDYPLTGVGMNRYRLREVRNRYPVEGYEDRVLPHTHNEVLQVGTDMGVPGIILYVGLHILGLWMLVRIWRTSAQRSEGRMMAVALAGCFVAHTVFGLADAITLWDRFIFVFWWLVGMVGAQYYVSVRLPALETKQAQRDISASIPASTSPDAPAANPA